MIRISTKNDYPIASASQNKGISEIIFLIVNDPCELQVIAMAKLSIQYRAKDGGATKTFDFSDVDIDETTLFDLKEQLTMKSNISIVRQRLSLQHLNSQSQAPLLDEQKSLRQLNFSPTGTNSLILKDIGPQIAWETVFYLEYTGPLLVHQVALLFWDKLSTLQILGYVAICFHFLKREYETAFVHRFSHATMPLINLAKNCFHYWIIGGILLTLELYFTTPFRTTFTTWIFFLLFLLMEIGNFTSHIMLRNLRPPGTTQRSIPRGFLFEYVSCPNYFFESVAWIFFSLMTRCYSAWLFWAIGTAQMFLWAKKKHATYRKEFKDYPKQRKIMFPFLI